MDRYRRKPGRALEDVSVAGMGWASIPHGYSSDENQITFENVTLARISLGDFIL